MGPAPRTTALADNDTLSVLLPGPIDLSTRVWQSGAPDWLADVLARAVPDRTAYAQHNSIAWSARAALARRHAVPISGVLPTSGTAEAISLLARVLRPRRAVVVHPQSTGIEAVLRATGTPPARHLLRAQDGFRLDPDRLDPQADLVVIGNPTDPTGVLHSAGDLRALRRPGRVVVVDEALMDLVPGQHESLIGADMAGVIVLRSPSTAWRLAGLRGGYLVGDASLVVRLATQQPPSSLSATALAVIEACTTARALGHTRALALALDEAREAVVDAVTRAGLSAVPSHAPFVLVDTSRLGTESIRDNLARRGFLVTSGERFPGLGPTWIRIAVRDRMTTAVLATALRDVRDGRRERF